MPPIDDRELARRATAAGLPEEGVRICLDVAGKRGVPLRELLIERGLAAAASIDALLDRPAPEGGSPRGGAAAGGPPAPGDRIGDYTVVAEAGRDPVRLLYRVRREGGDTESTLVLLHPGVVRGPDGIARFKRAGAARARLDHPSIVPIREAGEHGGSVFCVMDAAAGTPLEEVLAKEKPSLDRRLEWIEQVADAVSAAHRQGIVPVDPKIEEVVVGSDGRARLLHVGLGAFLEEAARRSGPVAAGVTGRPVHLSPERLAGGEADAAGDVYSLGMLLYRTVTGDLPFQASAGPAWYSAVMERDPVPPRRFVPDLPPGVEDVVLRAIARDPAQRIGSADALVRALRGIRTGEVDEAAPEPATAEGGIPGWLIPAGVFGLLFLIGFLVWRAQRDEGQDMGSEWGGAVVEKPSPVDPILQEVESRMDEGGDAADVLVLLDRAVATDPESARARFARARLLDGIGRWEDALEDLKAILGRAPGHLVARRLEADLLAALGRTEAANGSLGRIIDTEPDRLEGVYARAMRNRREGNLHRARELIDIAARRGRNWAYIHAARGRIRLAQGERDGAIGDFEEAVHRYPYRAMDRLERGRLRLELGERDADALADFDRALALWVPPSAEIHVLRARALDRMGRSDEAAAACEAALGVDPDAPEALAIRARLRERAGEYEAGRADVERALDAAPDDADLHCLHGILLHGLGRERDARRALDRAIRLDADHPGARAARGALHYDAGRIEEAIEDLDRATELAPREPRPFLLRGRIHLRAERFAEAREDLARFLKLAPTHPEAQIVRLELEEAIRRSGGTGGE